MSRLTVVVLLPVVLLLGACAAADGDDSASGSSSPELSSVPPPTLATPPPKPTGPTDTFKRVTIVGVVAARGEGCVTLTSDVGVQWALLGGEVEGLEVGARVKVTGRAAFNALPVCAGAPLTVQSVQVLPS